MVISGDRWSRAPVWSVPRGTNHPQARMRQHQEPAQPWPYLPHAVMMAPNTNAAGTKTSTATVRVRPTWPI